MLVKEERDRRKKPYERKSSEDPKGREKIHSVWGAYAKRGPSKPGSITAKGPHPDRSSSDQGRPKQIRIKGKREV